VLNAPAPYCCHPSRLLIGNAARIFNRRTRELDDELSQAIESPADVEAANPIIGRHIWQMGYCARRRHPERWATTFSDGSPTTEPGGGKGAGGRPPREDPEQIFGITESRVSSWNRSRKAGNPFYVQVSHYPLHLDFYREQSSGRGAGHENPGKNLRAEFAATLTRCFDEGMAIVWIRSSALLGEFSMFLSCPQRGRNTMLGQKGKGSGSNHPLRDMAKFGVMRVEIRVPFIVWPGVQAGTFEATCGHGAG